MSFRVHRSREQEDRWKASPLACWQVPYCIACTRAEAIRRTLDAFNSFSLATPLGKKPRFIHVVMTGPAFVDGRGWGWKASEHIGKFAHVIRKSLEDFHGAGIGGLMSHQDFGEKGFVKRHPHMDLTLNGYQFEEGKIEPVDASLAHGGYARLAESTRVRAMSFEVDAVASNIKYGQPRIGFKQYYAILRYQVRELVDLRKVVYDRAAQTVGWRSYHDERIAKLSVAEWLDAYRDYRRRLRMDEEREAKSRFQLHRYFGHTAKRVLQKTSQLVGGTDMPHGQDRPCNECGDGSPSTMRTSASTRQRGS